jgi:hypothetical protein
VTIVMGLDQHRAQITAEWLDTETGEVSRARVTPADRRGVRRFLTRFAGQRLEDIGGRVPRRDRIRRRERRVSRDQEEPRRGGVDVAGGPLGFSAAALMVVVR